MPRCPIVAGSALAALLLMLVALAGCPETGSTPAQRQQEHEATGQEVLADLEPRMAAWRALPPDQRLEQGRAFGPELESALKTARGSSAQNKILLWLADWRWRYADGQGVDSCLDELDASKFPQVKAWGQRLRVLWLLRNGDVRQARDKAQDLVSRIPEFQPLLNLVLLHESIGHRPPRTAGQNLSGGPDDPAAGRTSRYLVYVFMDALDTEALFVLRNWLLEASNPAYLGQVRIVLVTSESPPLGVEGKIRTLPGLDLLDVLWAPPGADADAGVVDWRTAWKLSPDQLIQVVLGPGPKRLILAVPFEPEDLRILLGAPAPGAAAH